MEHPTKPLPLLPSSQGNIPCFHNVLRITCVQTRICRGDSPKAYMHRQNLQPITHDTQTHSTFMTIGFDDTVAPPSLIRCSSVLFTIASATAVSGIMGGPYSSEASSCSLQRGSLAVGSWYIWTMSGLRVPISTSRTLKRNCACRCGTQVTTHSGEGRTRTGRCGQHSVTGPGLSTCANGCLTADVCCPAFLFTGTSAVPVSACQSGHARGFGLTPRKASSSDDLPSDCPPMATISGMGKLSPMATDVACRRLWRLQGQQGVNAACGVKGVRLKRCQRTCMLHSVGIRPCWQPCSMHVSRVECMAVVSALP